MPSLRSFQPCPLLAVALLATCLVLLPRPAAALTQKDWMVALVDSLGRSFGLPDQPKPEDYINLLQGRRSLRLEAETARVGDDAASVMSFSNYGPFSGKGWLLAPGQPTPVRLRFTLPLDGRYRVSVAARLPGHTLRVGGQSVTVDGDRERFSRVDAGEFNLTAGLQEIVVTLPPGGALDYVELTAPGISFIAPDGGWKPEAPLTWEVFATTTVQALHLEGKLTLTDRTLTVEAETLAETDGARVAEDAHLGRPSGGRWLRTTAQPATVVVPLAIDASGFYDIILTAMGSGLALRLNDHPPLAVEGRPYLDVFPPRQFFLSKGSNRLEVILPPGSGLDRIAVRARQSDLAALAAAAGITMSGDAPTSADLDRLTTRLSSAAR